MKAIVFAALFCAFFCLEAAAQTASCFDHFLNEAEAALHRRRPNFELARKKFAAAKECDDARPDQKRDMERRIREVEAQNIDALENEIDKAEKALFEAEIQKKNADTLRLIAVASLEKTEVALQKADSLRREALRSARRALANDLAFKAQTALRDGDRTTAFRLAEMSWRFVDPGNQRTEQALVEAYFQNETARNARPMAWRKASFALLGETESALLLRISTDGKAVAAATDAAALRLWEIETGRELFAAFETEQIAALAVADEGRFLAFSDGKSLRIWQKNGPPEARSIFDFADAVADDLRITSDQKRLIAHFSDHSIIVFDLETGAQRGNFGTEKEGQTSHFSQFSPDGKRLVLTDGDGLFQLFDLEKGQITGRFGEKSNGKSGGGSSSIGSPILALAQSFDGQRIAVARTDRSMRLFDLKSGQVALEFRPEKLAAFRLTFSGDDRFLTAFFIDGELRKWDATTGELVEKRSGVGADDPAMEQGYFIRSGDGRRFLSQTFFGQAELFDRAKPAADGQPTTVFRFDQHIRQAFFSPVDSAIFFSLENGESHFCHSATGARLMSFAGEKAVAFADFATKSRVFALAREQGPIEVWAAETQSCLYPSLGKGHAEAFDFVLSPDQKTMAVTLVGDSVQFRSMTDGRWLFSKKGLGSTVIFSLDGRLAGLFSYGLPTATIIDAASGEVLKKLDLNTPSGIFSINFSPDSRWIQLFDVAEPGKTLLFDAATFAEKSLPAGVEQFVFSTKSNQTAFVFSSRSMLQPFDLEKMEPSGPRLEFEPQSLSSLRFSPTGDRLFFLEYGRTAHLFEWPSGRKIWSVEVGSLQSMQWTPDGKRLISTDFYLLALDAATGRKLYDLPFSGYQNDLSADGSLLLAVLGTRDAAIFDATTGQKLVSFRSRGQTISDAKLSPDGRRAVTATQDGFAEVWDAATGRPLFVLRGDSFAINRAFFIEKGSKLAIWQGKSIKIWELSPTRIFEKAAEQGAIAPLTASQIFDFLAGEAVFEKADWNQIRDEIQPPQALELARFFSRQADLGRDAATYDKNFGLAEQFYRSALNDLGSPSILFELAAANARWMERSLASARRDETLREAKKVEKLLRSATVLPAASKLDLAQALTILGKKDAAKALFSEAFSAQDTSARSGFLYQIEQNSRNLSALEASDFDDYGGLADSLKIGSGPIIGEAVSIENDRFLSSFDLFSVGETEKAVASARSELANALDNHRIYSWQGSASQVATAMGNLSFYLLFEKRFEEARAMAEFGAAVDPTQRFIATNSAHAHLFLGDWKRAAGFYESLKNEPDPSRSEGEKFGKTMLEDLENLAEKGIRCRDMARAVELLTGQKLSKIDRVRFE